MAQHQPLIRQVLIRLGLLAGCSLVGLAIFPPTARAQIGKQLNPCPGIYYENPYDYSRLVPQGCPPNMFTRLLIEQGRISGNQYPMPGSQMNGGQPTPSAHRQGAIATVTPVSGAVSVRLQNNTNTQIDYQAVGYTDRRVLTSGSEVVLQNLPVPVTITITRQDNGFLQVKPLSTNQSSLLSVTLDETTNPRNSQKTISIQRNGQVLSN